MIDKLDIEKLKGSKGLNSSFTFKIEDYEKDEFIENCKTLELSTGKVLREMIKVFNSDCNNNKGK